MILNNLIFMNSNYFNAGFLINNRNLFEISKQNIEEFDGIIQDDNLRFHGKKSIRVLNASEIQKYNNLNNVFEKVSKYLEYNLSNLDISFEDVWVQESKYITYGE